MAQGDATLENAVYKVFANEDIYNVAKSKKSVSYTHLYQWLRDTKRT